VLRPAASHRYHYVLFQEDGEALATCLSLLDQGVVEVRKRSFSAIHI
jgi:primosomal protein N''